MNEAHKRKLADRQAKRFEEACRAVVKARDTFGSYHPLTVEAREKRNKCGERLVMLDGHHWRYDSIMERIVCGMVNN